MYTPHQFAKEFKEFYEDTIKPLVKKGNYSTIHSELGDSVDYMNQYLSNIIETTHCGLSLCASIRDLHESTENGREPHEDCFINIEAYLAQTRLPI